MRQISLQHGTKNDETAPKQVTMGIDAKTDNDSPGKLKRTRVFIHSVSSLFVSKTQFQNYPKLSWTKKKKHLCHSRLPGLSLVSIDMPLN